MQQSMTKTVLILGGYGNVGRTIATSLMENTDAQLIIAGRRHTSAEKLAWQLGERAQPRQIDVTQITNFDVALANVDLVVVCFDLPDDVFPRTCLERGIDYIDISAEPDVLKRIEALGDVAQEHNATALISVGLMPGISNLMAKHGFEQVKDAHRVDNAALLGLGEAFGAASVKWTLSHIGDRYDQNSIRVDMGKGFGIRTVYRFAFADQFSLTRTQPIDEARSWGCYDSAWLTRRIGIVRWLRLGWLYRQPLIQRLMIRFLNSVRVGSENFVLTTRIQDRQSRTLYQAWLSGQREADVTARVAAEAVCQMIARPFPKGVHHSDQVFELDAFLPLLEDVGTSFEESK